MTLSSAEREARRRERSRRTFSDASYAHYDPSVVGFGSPRDWMDAAEAMAEGRGAYVPVRDALDALTRDSLRLLGLDAMPDTAQALKSAFRKAAFSAHPDHGGTAVAFQRLLLAFERLVGKYRKGA